MSITFPTNTRDTINAIRLAIGRNVTFYTVTSEDCPACSIDPVTNTSTNPFCTTCSGEGYLYTFSGASILAHITWAPAETLDWVSGGQMMQGDCRVQIEHTVGNISILENTEYVMVDGKRFLVDKIMYRGVPALNRILIDLKEDE